MRYFLLFLAFTLALAQTPAFATLDRLIPCGYNSDCGQADLVSDLPQGDARTEIIPAVVRLLIYLLGATGFLVFAVAGGMLVLSYGNQEMFGKAKKLIIWGIMGMAVAAAAYALVSGFVDFVSAPPDAPAA